MSTSSSTGGVNYQYVQKGNQALNDQYDILDKIQEAENNLVALSDKLIDARRDTVKVEDKLLKSFKDESKNLERQVRLAEQSGKFTKAELQDANDLVDAMKDQAKKQEALNNKLKNSDSSFRKILATAGGLTKEIDRFVDMLPGGKTLTRLLGINDISTTLQDAADKGMEAYADALDANKSEAEAQADAMAAFGKAADAAVPKIKKLAALLVFVTILKAAISAFNEFAKSSGEIATNFELTTGEAAALNTQSLKLQSANSNRLASQKEILGVQQATAKAFNGIVQLTDKNVLQLAQLNHELGIGAEATGELAAQFMLLGASQNDAVANIKVLNEEATEAGISAAAVAKDLSTNAKSAARFFGQNTKALVKAAVEAAKFGMSIKDTVTVAEKLLDIEGSLTAQFELMAYTGKEINADRARELALAGKTTEAAVELINQFGGLPSDPLEMQMMENLTGLTADKLAEIYSTSTQIAGLTPQEKADRQKAADAAAHQVEQQKKLSVAMEKMSSVMNRILVPLATTFASIFTFLAPVIDGFLAPFKILAFLFEYINELITQAKEEFAAFGIIADVISFVFETIGSTLSVVLIPALTVLAVKGAIAAGKMVIQAIGGIFSTFSQIPFGIGIPIAVAAVGTLIALVGRAVSQVGDLGIDPNGGPIVSSPQMGGIFQGKRGDGLSMGPTMGVDPDLGTTSPSGGTNLSALEAKFDQMIRLLGSIANTSKNPPPVAIGNKVIDELGSAIEINRTYS